jgi:hypothetical protein
MDPTTAIVVATTTIFIWNLPTEMIEMILIAAGDENHRLIAAVCWQWREIIVAYRRRHKMVSLETAAFLRRHELTMTDDEWE